MTKKKLQGGKLAGGNSERGRVKDDYYATPSEATLALLQKEDIIYPALEPACGEGFISKLLDESDTTSSDLIDRGYGQGNTDFLFMNTYREGEFNTVITNPPFNLFLEFAMQALQIARRKVILFGKIQALEGVKRATFLENSPLKTVYVFKNRINPLRNGSEFDENGKKWASTMCFAWYVWEIGYEGQPIIKWL